MSGPGACEAAGLGFDHRAEVIAAPGALLSQVGADVGQLLPGERFVQQAAPEGGEQRCQVHLSRFGGR